MIDSCTFVRAAAGAIELGEPNQHIVIRNCLFIDNNGGGNGQVIDMRSGPHRYVKFENNSSYFETDRIFRHYSYDHPIASVIDTIIVNHNTFTNNLGFYGSFMFGSVKYLQFTNNLIWNGGQLGTDNRSRRVDTSEVLYIIDSVTTRVGPNALVHLSVIETAKYNTKILCNHNNIYLDPIFQAKFDKYDATFSRMPTWSYDFVDLVMASGIDTNEAVFEEPLVLANVPHPSDWIEELDETFYALTDTLTIGGTIYPWNRNTDTLYLYKQTGFDVAATPPDFIPRPWKLLDFSYPTDSKSYTAAHGSYPIGDLNWFPDKKAEWEWYPFAIQTPTDNGPQRFELSQNYPNPFNPTTTISYTLTKAANINIAVYNMLGQKVATLVSGPQLVGTHQVKWNAEGFASGVYYYRLKSESGFVQTKKLILLK